MTHGGAYVAGEMYYGFRLIELYLWSPSVKVEWTWPRQRERHD